MPDSNVAITAGSGTLVDTFQLAGGDHQQVVRPAAATAVSLNTWTVTTTGQASQVAADLGRVGLLMVNTSTGRVYLRFDSTIPTSTAHHWFLEPGDRYEVPSALVALAVSMLGTVAAGTVLSCLATAA